MSTYLVVNIQVPANRRYLKALLDSEGDQFTPIILPGLTSVLCQAKKDLPPNLPPAINIVTLEESQQLPRFEPTDRIREAREQAKALAREEVDDVEFKRRMEERGAGLGGQQGKTEGSP